MPRMTSGRIDSAPPCGRSSLFLLAAFCAASPSGVVAADESCRAGPAWVDRLAGLGPRGELIFASGQRAVLSDARWTDDPAVEASARTWLLNFREKPLILTERGSADRWGRHRVDAVSDGGEPEDLAGGLIAAGLAYADPGEADLLCRPGLRSLEAAPRAAGLGIWTGARSRPKMRRRSRRELDASPSWWDGSSMSVNAAPGPISTSLPGERRASP
ncbi:hypothetical protein ACFQWF_06080 [Methylorubrum suomiense]